MKTTEEPKTDDATDKMNSLAGLPELLKETSEFIEKLPNEIIETYGGRYPMSDELWGSARMLEDLMQSN